MKKILFTIILFAIILSCNKTYAAGDEAVATWRGGKLTVNDFQYFIEKYGDKDQLKQERENLYTTIEKKKGDLEFFLKTQLFEQESFKRRLDTLKIFQDSYKRKIYAHARNKLLKDSLKENIFSEYELQQYYNSQRYLYSISQIFISAPNKYYNKNKIDSVYNFLKSNPLKFEQVATKISNETSNTENSQFLLSDLNCDISIVLQNMDVGDISKPIKSSNGWHIIRLNQKSTNHTLKNYSNEKNSIISKLIDTHKDRFDSRQNKFISFLFNLSGVKLFDENIYGFILFYNTKKEQRDTLSFQDAYDENTVLAKINNHLLTVADLNNYLKAVKFENTNPIDYKNILLYIYRYFQIKLLDIAVDKLWYIADIQIHKEASLMMIPEYFEYIVENELAKFVPEISEQECREYFNLNKNDFKYEGIDDSYSYGKNKIIYKLKQNKIEVIKENWLKYLYKKHNVSINYIVIERYCSMLNSISDYHK